MRPLVLLALFAVAACTGGGSIGLPRPTETRTGKPPRPGTASPGFDKRDFPGLGPMQTWWSTSPFEWVGYYLPSPCYAGVAWTGNRQQLMNQGWGLAVLYVGLQAPRPQAAAGAATSAVPDSSSAAAVATRCATNTLSAQQGREDADDAVNIAAADGFPEGTTIFLDVERTAAYTEALDAYVRAWVGRVLERRFTPGIYGHRINAEALFSSQRAVYRSAGDQRDPPFWLSNSQGFDLARTPAESGFPFATVWQNPSDANQTYGGVTFRIDDNVATKKNPSGP